MILLIVGNNKSSNIFGQTKQGGIGEPSSEEAMEAVFIMVTMTLSLSRVDILITILPTFLVNTSWNVFLAVISGFRFRL